MESIFVVTAVSTKERCSNKSINLDKVVFIDIEKNKVAQGLINQASINRFDIKNRRYQDDLVNIEDSIGTLAFINKKYKFYGVLRYMGNKLYIEWITEEHLKNDKNLDNLANIHGDLVDITSLGTKVFTKDWLNTVRKICVTEINYKVISTDKFIHNIEVENKEDEKTNEEITLSKKEETETIVEQNENKKDITVEILNKDILNKLVELEIREKALTEKERSIQEKCDKINRILSKLENVDVNKLIGTVVDADNIYKFDTVKEEKLSKADLANEFALKMLNNGDEISIDKSYFNKIKCLNKKSIESNVAYTYYKMIVALKFERESQYAIFGILDYNEDKEFVKFKVLKSYTNSDITDEEINKFYLEYLKKQRQKFN